jgi:tetratricopeptide (TPR) repeat protein
LKESFDALYNEAKALFEGGRLLDAERIYRRLLEHRPQGYAEIYNKLGLIASQKGNLQEAADFFRKALSLNPRYTEASLNLSVTLNDLGLYEEAGETFSKAAQRVRANTKAVDPYIIGKLANEHGRLADQYAEVGLYDEAIEEYRKAVALRAGLVDILTKLGVALREKGRFDEAIQTFLQAKEANPRYIPALIHLGVAYYMMGFVDLARRSWEEAQEVNPGNHEVGVYLALARKEVLEK